MSLPLSPSLTLSLIHLSSSSSSPANWRQPRCQFHARVVSSAAEIIHCKIDLNNRKVERQGKAAEWNWESLLPFWTSFLTREELGGCCLQGRPWYVMIQECVSGLDPDRHCSVLITVCFPQGSTASSMSVYCCLTSDVNDKRCRKMLWQKLWAHRINCYTRRYEEDDVFLKLCVHSVSNSANRPFTPKQRCEDRKTCVKHVILVNKCIRSRYHYKAHFFFFLSTQPVALEHF